MLLSLGYTERKQILAHSILKILPLEEMKDISGSSLAYAMIFSVFLQLTFSSKKWSHSAFLPKRFTCRLLGYSKAVQKKKTCEGHANKLDKGPQERNKMGRVPLLVKGCEHHSASILLKGWCPYTDRIKHSWEYGLLDCSPIPTIPTYSPTPVHGE